MKIDPKTSRVIQYDTTLNPSPEILDPPLSMILFYQESSVLWYKVSQGLSITRLDEGGNSGMLHC